MAVPVEAVVSYFTFFTQYNACSFLYLYCDLLSAMLSYAGAIPARAVIPIVDGLCVKATSIICW